MHQGAADALKWLERRGSKRVAQGMARYGIPSEGAFGVPMGTLQKQAKRLGKDHALALALWETGRYEARLLAALVDDPAQVTPRQMDAWARDFSSWADCDTACFTLFDRTPHAWAKAPQWARSPSEFVKRAGFALMACLALHDKAAPDAKLRAFLPLVEQGARDERNFVKKGVSWALRSIGRRNLALHAPALAVAKRLSQRDEPGCRWVGKDALRELASPKLRARLAQRG